MGLAARANGPRGLDRGPGAELQYDGGSTLACALLAALLADVECVRQLAQAVAEFDGSTSSGPPAYTVDGLAQAIAVSPRVVRNAISRGELLAVKRGGRWLIAADALESWTHGGKPPSAGRPGRIRGAAASRRTPLHDALARLERA